MRVYVVEKTVKHIIKAADSGSIAEELGIKRGDELLLINGKKIRDIFSYRLAAHSCFLTLTIKGRDGVTDYEIEKDEDEDLGLDFGDGIMDEPKRCRNKCVFCFVDQLPDGLRETLYFKDDDMRLSFLTGNYVTLTNMSDKDLDEIISYRLSPVNISVHSANADVRAKMLGVSNKRLCDIVPRIKKLYENNIEMNFQIVLCKGLNDGDELDSTIAALVRFFPKAVSLSVVPVGITKYREQNGLFPLSPLDESDCAAVIHKIHGFQKRFLAAYGTRFVYAADEFYVKSGMDLPLYDEYEDFPQLDNGVGALALLEREFTDFLPIAEKTFPAALTRAVTIVTGAAAYKYIKNLTHMLSNAFKSVIINVVRAENAFFGEHITVSGLLTGRDILNALKGRDLGHFVLVPKNALKYGENIFLDDVTTDELSRALNIKIKAPENTGQAFIIAILE